jgi:hypothetical protein
MVLLPSNFRRLAFIFFTAVEHSKQVGVETLVTRCISSLQYWQLVLWYINGGT